MRSTLKITMRSTLVITMVDITLPHNELLSTVHSETTSLTLNVAYPFLPFIYVISENDIYIYSY